MDDKEEVVPLKGVDELDQRAVVAAEGDEPGVRRLISAILIAGLDWTCFSNFEVEKISVSVNPGRLARQLTPSPAYSAEMPSLNLTIIDLVAAYKTSCGVQVNRPAIDATLMIRPHRCSTIAGSSRWVSYNVDIPITRRRCRCSSQETVS